MVLPLYLAMTREEMATCPALPAARGWMGCPFSEDALPEKLPPETMLILTDRFPVRGGEDLIGRIRNLRCGSLLLDFERQPDDNSRSFAKAVFETLPCPVAAPPGFLPDSDRAVFLPSCPLHVPLAEYLAPWQGREIWLEAALQMQTITVDRDGVRYGPAGPPDRLEGGTFDDTLQCRCVTRIADDAVRFTLFDTPETLARKLDRAAALGVSRTVGLYQQLGPFFAGCFLGLSALE